MPPGFDTAAYRVPSGEPAALDRRPTRVDPWYGSNGSARDLLDASREELKALQEVLYAHNRYAVLLVFQGMDTAGKGGAIKHVMSGINPAGCQVFSFGPPGEEDLDHDFLWRFSRCLPERGRIGIFDRSHYEEVLVTRVKPAVLQRQRVPVEHLDPARLWRDRFQDIVNFEEYLHRNGIRIVKFFLHLSREEQCRRLLARLDAPEKNWKMSHADLDTRGRWDDFMAAYEDCLAATSHAVAPWHVIPADDKRNARLIISRIVVEAMQDLPLAYPVADAARSKELAEMRKVLERESKRG